MDNTWSQRHGERRSVEAQIRQIARAQIARLVEEHGPDALNLVRGWGLASAIWSELTPAQRTLGFSSIQNTCTGAIYSAQKEAR